jgi:hypothetical protein
LSDAPDVPVALGRWTVGAAMKCSFVSVRPPYGSEGVHVIGVGATEPLTSRLEIFPTRTGRIGKRSRSGDAHRM